MPKILKKKNGYIRKKNGKTESVKPHNQHYHTKIKQYKKTSTPNHPHTIKKKEIGLRVGNYNWDHRSKDTVVEVLSWNLNGKLRCERQEWWDEMIEKFPEIKKYVGKTEETDHPEKTPQELLKKIGEFICDKEEIYESVSLDEDYKTIVNARNPKTPVLIMKGINVNAGRESMELVYNSRKGAILKGDVIDLNTWGDGEVMTNFEVLYEFNPQDPKEILEGILRFGEKAFGGFWNKGGTEEWYKQEYYNEYTDEWEGEPLKQFEERIKVQITNEQKE